MRDKKVALVPQQFDDITFWHVYILKCADEKSYTGYTSDLNDRLNRHHRGSVPATKNRRPLQLITYLSFSDQYQAP